jgi:HTH-type transcriptional regulator / antitoxin HigA
MKSLTHTNGNAVPKVLSELYAQYPIRPIHDEVDLDNAMEVADRLAVLSKRTDDQNDYLELLSDAIEKYEKEHHPINTQKLDPIETLRLLMQQRSMNASDLGRVLGNRSLGTKIIKRRRKLSQSNISALCKHFAVGPQVFFKV